MTDHATGLRGDGETTDGADSEASDRRSDSRIRSIHLAQVSRFDEDGYRADLATGRTLDISRGGVKLELYHPLPLRSRVHLDMVAGDQIFTVHGAVVYLEAIDDQRSVMGIAFDELHPETQKLIDGFVDEAKSP